ncbi:hypothetical protein D3C81_1534370 [compost metagenome]
MSQRSAGGNDLGTAHVDAAIIFMDHAHEYVRCGRRRQIAIHRGIDHGMAQVPGPLLSLAIPVSGVFLIALVERRVGPQRSQERALVVRRPSHPAPSALLPAGNRIALRHLLGGVARGAEEALGKAAPFGRNAEFGVAFRIMQRLVHPGNHARHIAKGRMLGDIAHALAVDPHFAPIVQALQELLPRERYIDAVVGAAEIVEHIVCLLSERVWHRTCNPAPALRRASAHARS